MSLRRLLLVMFAALAAIAGAYYLSAQRNLVRDLNGTALLPGLAAQLNSVSSVSISKGGPAPAVTVHRVGDRWAVEQLGDYPADTPKLRRLLLALGDAKIVEEKTSNPANYAALGVDDPAKAGAAGAEITWETPGGRHSLIVGKPAGQGVFVRRAAESQSFLVEPAIPLDAQPRLWIDGRLLDVPVATVRSITVKFADGTGYTLQRSSPKDESFALEDVPAGRKARDTAALAPSPTLLAGLTAEDVGPAGTVDDAKAATAAITTSDGAVLTLLGVVAQDKHWVTITATGNDALTAKAAGRAFELAGNRYEAIFRPLDELLVPKETPAAKSAPRTQKSAPHPHP